MPLNSKWTEDRITKKLMEINSSVPEQMKKALVQEVLATPTQEMVAKKALEDPDFPEEKKERLRNLLASGVFSKKRIKTDSKVEKQIDLYISRKVNEAIKRGELPSRNQIKNFPWLKKYTQYNSSKKTSN